MEGKAYRRTRGGGAGEPKAAVVVRLFSAMPGPPLSAQGWRSAQRRRRRRRVCGSGTRGRELASRDGRLATYKRASERPAETTVGQGENRVRKLIDSVDLIPFRGRGMTESPGKQANLQIFSHPS